MAKGNVRIQVSVSPAMLQRIDEEASLYGTTRSAICSTWIGEKVRNLDLQKDLMKQLLSEETLNNLMKYAMEAKFNGPMSKEDYEQLTIDLAQKVGG